MWLINVYRVKVQAPKPLFLLEGGKKEESRILLPQSSRADILMESQTHWLQETDDKRATGPPATV